MHSLSAASGLLLSQLLSLTELGILVLARLGSGALSLRDGDLIFDFTSHQGEDLLNVLAVLGGCFHEANAVMISEFLALLK